MNNIIYVFIFLLGLGIGSFLNCIIYRLEVNQSFLKGRSYCPDCKYKLNWYDLIPIFSFLILKGKCRYCQKRISLQYPLVEVFAAIIFVLVALTISNNSTGVYLLLISCFLIVIFVYDLKHYIIPDKVIYPAIAITFLYQLFRILNLGFVSNFEFRISNFKTLINPLASALFASAFFLLIVLVSRGKWMGVGDIKLAFLMGLFLGFPKILVALFSAFLFGAIIGLGLIILKKKTLKSEVPFGPFLITGTFIAIFLGETIIKWYLRFLNF